MMNHSEQVVPLLLWLLLCTTGKTCQLYAVLLKITRKLLAACCVHCCNVLLTIGVVVWDLLLGVVLCATCFG